MNIKKATKTAACISIVILMVYMFGGCATIVKGSHNTVDFSSTPSGAQVYVNGVPRGATPVNLKLESKRTYTIEFQKEGYETKTYTITNHIGVGYVIIDVIFALIPVIVDAATGSWYDLDQDMVNAILEKQQ